MVVMTTVPLYRQLYEMTNQLANTLRAHGVCRGDRVVLYLPVMPITVAAMMACARIGALHNVVFAGFSAEALASRIQDGELWGYWEGQWRPGYKMVSCGVIGSDSGVQDTRW